MCLAKNSWIRGAGADATRRASHLNKGWLRRVVFFWDWLLGFLRFPRNRRHEPPRREAHRLRQQPILESRNYHRFSSHQCTVAIFGNRARIHRTELQQVHAGRIRALVELRGRRARTQGGYGDTRPTELIGQRLRKMQNVSLGRKINGHQRPRLKRRGGRHIQDAAALALSRCPNLGSLNHRRKIQAREVGESGDVELDLAQTFFQIIFGEQTVLSESRIVDQDINLNIRARRLVEYIRWSSRFGQVDGKNQRTRTVGLFEFRGELPEFVRAAGNENQVVAFAREDAGEFQSDAE